MFRGFLNVSRFVVVLMIAAATGFALPVFAQSQPKGALAQQIGPVSGGFQQGGIRRLLSFDHEIIFDGTRRIGRGLATRMKGQRDIEMVLDCSFIEGRNGEARLVSTLPTVNLKRLKPCMMFIDRHARSTDTYFVSNVPCVEAGPQDMNCLGGFKTFGHIRSGVEAVSNAVTGDFAVTDQRWEFDDYPQRALPGQRPRLKRSMFFRARTTFAAFAGAITRKDQRLNRFGDPVGKPYSRIIYTPAPVAYSSTTNAPSRCATLAAQYLDTTMYYNDLYFSGQVFFARPVANLITSRVPHDGAGNLLRERVRAGIRAWQGAGNYMTTYMLTLESQALEIICRDTYRDRFGQNGPLPDFDPDEPDEPIELDNKCYICSDWGIVRGPDVARQIPTEGDEAEAWEITPGEQQLMCLSYSIVSC